MACRLPSPLNWDLENSERPLQIYSEGDHRAYHDDSVFSKNYQAIFLGLHTPHRLQEPLGNPEGSNIQIRHLQHDLPVHETSLDGAFPALENHIHQRNAHIPFVWKCY